MSLERPRQLEYDVFPLASIREDRYSDLLAAVETQLEGFRCSRSPHLQDFARGKHQVFEAAGHVRTYVFIAEQAGQIVVPALFALGLSALDLSKASKSLQKKLQGSVSMKRLAAYVIAELARDDRFSSDDLPGAVILDEAKRIVAAIQQRVGGRFLMVDAQKVVFHELYEPAGFRQIATAEPPAGMTGDFITACCKIADW